MDKFPEFMQNPLNKISSQSQYTADLEGYVYDGADGSQMAIWTINKTASSQQHSHEFDEYIVVVQGQYTLDIAGQKITLNQGDEYVIPKGITHSGHGITGTRAIFAFGGKRVQREGVNGI